MITGIQAGANILLVPYAFPDHLEYLEMSFSLGDTSATIRTKKVLDADALKLVSPAKMLGKASVVHLRYRIVSEKEFLILFSFRRTESCITPLSVMTVLGLVASSNLSYNQFITKKCAFMQFIFELQLCLLLFSTKTIES